MAGARDRDRATYSDGRTAAVQEVQTMVSPAGIAIRGDGVDEYWDEAGLEVIDAPANGQALRLGHADRDGARLLLEGWGHVRQIRETMPGLLARRPDGRRYDLRKLCTAAGAVGALVGLFFLFLPSIVSGVAALFPASVEKRMGDQALSAFAQFFSGADSTCETHEGLRALDWMVVQLADGAEIDDDIDVRIVPVKMVNAVTFPGGTILIFDGLIRQAGSPEEVAGVLAHEMGHVVHHHGMERLVRDSAIGAVLSVFSPGAAGDVGGRLGGMLLTQSYGREAEREADAFAVETLNRIDVSTDGMARFFARMAEKHDDDDNGALMSYLASHPAPAERAAAIARRGSGEGKILSPGEWQALKSICGSG